MTSICSKAQELEREVNTFKAKYVTLLSDKFKVVVPSKLMEHQSAHYFSLY